MEPGGGLLPAQAVWVRDWRQRLHCTANRSGDGQPCGNFAMKGCWVCHAHGGRAPQTRRAAQCRLAGLATLVLASRACRRLGVA
jgi:hypothetical protein